MTIQDQPPPKPNAERRPAWELVIAYTISNYVEDVNVDEAIATKVVADMTQRDKIGRERYGVALTANNGRDALIDAYQEQLDCAVYLMAWLDEHEIDPDGDPTGRRLLTEREDAVLNLFHGAIETIINLRAIIDLA